MQQDLLSEQVRVVNASATSTSPTHGRDESTPAGSRPRGFVRQETGRPVPVRVETVAEDDDGDGSSWEEFSVIEEEPQIRARNRQVIRPTGPSRAAPRRV